MPITPTYPGVYIEEIPSGVRTITGVATSITAFIGRALHGPVNEPVMVNSYADFERIFGGLWVESTLSYAVRDFYLNGGSQALIVRCVHPNYVTAAERDNVFAAAHNVAKAAIDATAADAAKAAVENDAKAIQDNASSTEAEKIAAKAVSDAVATRAALEDIKQAATAAAAAVPPGRALLRLRTRIAEDTDALVIEAANEGAWGNTLGAHVDYDGLDAVGDRYKPLTKDDLFNLTIRNLSTGATERFLNVAAKDGSRRVDRVLENESSLARVRGAPPAARPQQTAVLLKQALQPIVDRGTATGASDRDKKEGSDAEKLIKALDIPFKPAEEWRYITVLPQDRVSDGGPLDVQDITAGPGLQVNKRGLYALEKAHLFNLLCIPPDGRGQNLASTIYQEAMQYCHDRRAILIVDSPAEWSANKETAAANAARGLSDLNLSGEAARNAALFFPRVIQADPQHEGQLDIFAPCGIIAGVIARTDVTRGVWKAPAGLDATLNGIQRLEINLTDAENGLLNPLGINCLRFFPGAGRVVWGARTLRGGDQLADEYKYIPVRRLALYIEESLYRGTQWVVFEPNDEPLWAQIRLNIGAFMHTLFRQGAFQGRTPREAYFVKCDNETTTQNDINLGIVNIIVGFAPLKPAEFVIIKLQQMAGQIAA